MKRPPILAEGVRPVPGQKYTLTEQFYQNFEIVKDPYSLESRMGESQGEVEIIEKRVAPGPMLIRGVFQREGVKNRNGRIYPKGLWEKHIKSDSTLMGAIKERRCYGQIEHPEGGAGSIKNAAILVTELKLDQHESEDGGRAVWGVAEVLDTPDGRIVRDLIRSNVTVGISSRGVGTVDRNGVVEEDNYTPETWDIVGNPSTPGAYVREKPVTEGVQNAEIRSFVRNGERSWTITENGQTREIRESQIAKGAPKMSKVKELTAQAAALLGTPIEEHADLASLDQALQTISISLNEEKAANPAVADIVLAEQEKIAAARKAIDEAKFKADDDDDDDDDDDSDDEDDSDDDDDDDEDTDESMSGEDIRALMTETLQFIEEQDVQIEAESQINKDLTERLAKVESERDALAESVVALERMVQHLTENEIDSDIDNAVAEAIQANPALASIRTLLEKCETVAELDEAVKSFKPAPVSEETKPSWRRSNRDDLPSLREGTNSNHVKTVTEDPKKDEPLDESASAGAHVANRIISRMYPGSKTKTNA